MQIDIEKIILIFILIISMIIFVVIGMIELKQERFIVYSLITGTIGVIITILISKNNKFIKK